ncbi:CpaF family protein [Candidatus Woesearchaeota archaeon]|nr:CpaF family protein [Candidatus Woesearchaeota archaeon]
MGEEKILDKYTVKVRDILVGVEIVTSEERPVPEYKVEILNLSDATKIILEKIRQEFISKVDLSNLDIVDSEQDLKKKFKKEIESLVYKYFPGIDSETHKMLVNYLIEESLGLGRIDILLNDPYLEEIVINNSKEPIWVYHRYYGWLETNLKVVTEERIRHYAIMIGRRVGKDITQLNPLMDAHLPTGDRVNATLKPISTKGNTITIRKFATEPWTITKFIRIGTIDYEAAALLWLAVQNELSILVTGGTGSGKTSMLNVLANFLPANQRIISIEDTRELTLPANLHWVPLETRLPNPEGKGGVTMLDLLVNSLRMRPDRIIVGEIRRKEEAEVLLEAMHTGHSVYATLHANDAEETVIRLTNPPIGIPKPMISAVSLILVQNRNRRTGKRRTFQIAEITPSGDPRILMQHNFQKDVLEEVNPSIYMKKKLKLYTGISDDEIEADLKEKERILRYMVKKRIEDVHKIGLLISKYYTGTLRLE